jgi:hypothetical protein
MKTNRVLPPMVAPHVAVNVTRAIAQALGPVPTEYRLGFLIGVVVGSCVANGASDKEVRTRIASVIDMSLSEIRSGAPHDEFAEALRAQCTCGGVAAGRACSSECAILGGLSEGETLDSGCAAAESATVEATPTRCPACEALHLYGPVPIGALKRRG